MRKSVTVLLSVLLALLIVGIAAAVPSPDPREEDVARHKDAYQPEEYSFLNNLGGDRGPEDDGPGDDGPGPEDEDGGLDFGDEDGGVDFGDEDDDGVDFGDE